jgi:hypothetical protein
MFSFVLTLVRLVGAFARKSRDPEFRNILVLLLILIASGTVFYSTVEGWNWFDALFVAAIRDIADDLLENRQKRRNRRKKSEGKS